jgi:hypothetical protein
MADPAYDGTNVLKHWEVWAIHWVIVEIAISEIAQIARRPRHEGEKGNFSSSVPDDNEIFA